MTQVLIITGASRGIGAATALLAASRGYSVCVNYRSNHQAAETVVKSIEEDGGKAIAVAADISKEEDVLRLFDTTTQALGAVTGLVNNAGILDKLCRLDEMSTERLRKIFDTNILGSFLCAREAVKRMSTKHGGNGGGIVNVSSIASRLGSPNEFVDYAASKGAIDTLTIGLAKEVATEGIRVNGVCPGLIDTEMHNDSGDSGRAFRLQGAIPMKRVGTADEVAKAILWLLSDEASYVTGSLFDVSGGR